MQRSNKLVKRSFEMIIASYYLARCGNKRDNKPSEPPVALGVDTWGAAYDCFFDAIGDGRNPAQFRNSIKNARDTFDTLFDNGRIGWIDSGGRQPCLSRSSQRIHAEWENRSNQELESFVFRLLTGTPDSLDGTMGGSEARTEGGQKVYVSVRPEREPALRRKALELHGLNCMACGFNYQAAYGQLGHEFIEVHHVTPLSEVGLTETDPKKDLVVLCANCHRMVHRKKGLCLTLGELRRHIRK